MKATAKRRRSKAQIQEERKQEEVKKQEIQAKLLAWDELQAELEAKTIQNQQLIEVNNAVGQMVEDGVIKQTGERQFEAVVDPDEREQIQSKRKAELSQ